MDAHSFENDIPDSLALAAHRGTSFVPETRAKQQKASYSHSPRPAMLNVLRRLTSDYRT
jgi:hypothetical protein